MPSPFTAVISFVGKGNPEWQQIARTSCGFDTEVILMSHDGTDEDYASGMRQAFERASQPLVLMMREQDVLTQELPVFMLDLIWDVDVVYPTIYPTPPDQDRPVMPAQVNAYPFGPVLQAHPFCPNRLRLSDYVSGGTMVKRDTYLEHGGHKGGNWELWRRLAAEGARFKHVPEAIMFSRDVERRDFGPAPDPELRATWYYQATYATTYVRCLLPARVLPGMAVDYVHLAESENGDVVFQDHSGAAVFQFPGDASRARLMLAMKQMGIRTLIEVDDNYLTASPNNNPGWARAISATHISHHSMEGHQEIVKLADGVIVSGEPLYKIYKKVHPHVYVCQNSVDPADWHMIDKPTDGILRIGWFASGSHVNDAPIIHRALAWASKQDGVEVILMGYNPLWTDVRYTHVPWTNDLNVYRTVMGRLDIGLCPILPTPWAVCRSDLKALEYTMAGAVPVMSDVSPYDPWLNGFGCLKAGTPNDWLKKIKYLVKNRADVEALKAGAKEYVLSKRTNVHEKPNYEAAIEGE